MSVSTTTGRAMAFGFAKQSAVASQGSSVTFANVVAPSAAATSTKSGQAWIRWLQGSSHYPNGTYNHEWEGDGTRGESLAYKQYQWGKATHICYPRPLDMAYLFQAFTGTGSNTVSGGASPYTDAIFFPATDTGNDYYTITSFMRGQTNGLQSFDALCYKLTLSGSMGQPVKLQSEWAAGGNVFVAAPSSINMGYNLWNGTASANTDTTGDGPYYFLAQGGNALFSTLSGLTSLQAAIKDFTFTFEATLNPQDYQGEYVFPLPMVVGNVQISGDMTMLWQDYGAMSLAYWGTSTISTGSGHTDIDTATSTLTGAGDMVLTLPSTRIQNVTGSTVVDGLAANAFTTVLEFPNCTYENVSFEPDLSGKPIEQKISIHALKGGTFTAAGLGAAVGPFGIAIKTEAAQGGGAF